MGEREDRDERLGRSIEITEREKTKRVYAVCAVIAFGFACILLSVFAWVWSTVPGWVVVCQGVFALIPLIASIIFWRKIFLLARQVKDKLLGPD